MRVGLTAWRWANTGFTGFGSGGGIRTGNLPGQDGVTCTLAVNLAMGLGRAGVMGRWVHGGLLGVNLKHWKWRSAIRARVAGVETTGG